MPKNQRFTEFVKKLRGKKETQFAFAVRTGINIATIHNWEQGGNVPEVGLLRLFLAAGPRSGELLESLGIKAMDEGPQHEDGYYKLRDDLEKIITSAQSQLIGQAEETLDRLAEKAQHMSHKMDNAMLPVRVRPAKIK